MLTTQADGGPAHDGTGRAVRLAAVLVTPAAGEAAPPGVDPDEFLLALAEDTYEIVAGLDLVEPVILAAGVDGLQDIAWPGTRVIDLPGSGGVTEAFAALAPYGQEAVVISGDAPDLPPLLIGKLFRELGRAPIAVCPASGGGAVAVAARLPFPPWATAGLDDEDMVARLRGQAPGRRMVATGPGWHRLRVPADIARLDPGLEGWDTTRALLSGH
ncbi:hypothetical protein Sme01_12310 [Sphaerisporangium melleum]|uniref:Uncharacterized protein n=1 Tax=Sphaerisporangium melleum TaxID=321316 RepID=A0A917RIE1_9ACTN|nr:hypothetical protein [Sphaerisporangium melleum]GGL09029.1 hypothetical protein GCM10007964_59110 [Sphaerisporangium melleum]GII68755.1 hypothetical protein Sme01_12310 [Sphaerisporangium melleum]